MFLRREGCNTVNLQFVFRISIGVQDNEKKTPYIKFDYKQEKESWNKFFFESEEERDEYFEALNDLIDAKEVEIDLIGKLK